MDPVQGRSCGRTDGNEGDFWLVVREIGLKYLVRSHSSGKADAVFVKRSVDCNPFLTCSSWVKEDWKFGNL